MSEQLTGRTVQPARLPTDSALDEFEMYERQRIHVRVIYDGALGFCWCGTKHAEGKEIVEMRVTTKQIEKF